MPKVSTIVPSDFLIKMALPPSTAISLTMKMAYHCYLNASVTETRG